MSHHKLNTVDYDSSYTSLQIGFKMILTPTHWQVKICKIRYSWSTTTFQTATVLQPVSIYYYNTATVLHGMDDVDNNGDDCNYGENLPKSIQLTQPQPEWPPVTQGMHRRHKGLCHPLYMIMHAMVIFSKVDWNRPQPLFSPGLSAFKLVIKSCSALCQWIALQQ